MGCRIISDSTGEMACFYCSTTMIAFGPVTDAEELARFEGWLDEDPRGVEDIMGKWVEFCEEVKNE